MDLEKVIEYALFATISGYLTWQRLATNRANKIKAAEEAEEAEKERLYGLKPNPLRCGEHTDAIRALEVGLAEVRVELERFRGDFKAHVASQR